MPPSTTTAYVALGANLGDRAANLQTAIDQLAATPGLRLTRVSSFMDNPAVGGPSDSPPFLNAVAEVQTSLSPQSLLDRLLDIERSMGRVRQERWGPRAIDLDVILFGDRIVKTPTLELPHPRMHERLFVLQPLAEIAPNAWHPRLQRTAGELLHELLIQR